ncbi:hypothetical protein AURDEDRAFT_172673 [Auricularia subglabra TFB-10046 SS5]|nr:hypothetical protein AURDEDRAFT_172673 [Auricularia subglabra TFB-10046 SS5]
MSSNGDRQINGAADNVALETTCPYEVLGIAPDANESEINEAFKLRILQLDKGAKMSSAKDANALNRTALT